MEYVQCAALIQQHLLYHKGIYKMANKIFNISKSLSDKTLDNSTINSFQFMDISMESKYKKNTYPNAEEYSYEIEKYTDLYSIQNSLKNIFTWVPGERILNPEFGTKLKTYLYEGLTESNITKIIDEIKLGITTWEPRVTIVDILNNTNYTNKEDNTIVLNIVYQLNNGSKEKYIYEYKFQK